MCKFELLFNNCQTEYIQKISSFDMKYDNSDSSRIFNKAEFEIIYYFYLFKFITQIILFPCFCILNIILCTISIKVLRNKNYKKELSQNLFIYAQINFIFNLVYSLLMLFKDINNCLTFPSVYCPSYVMKEPIQYIDIWIFKYFTQIFKFCSTITEVSISYSRLINILNLKNKFSDFFNKINFKIYVFIIFFTGLVLNLNRLFQYKVNTMFNSDTFPYYVNDFDEKTNMSVQFILVSIYAFINSVLTMFLIIGIDAYLLRRIIRQNKQKLFMVFKNKSIDDCIKREERITRLIIISTIFMTLIRLPELLFLGFFIYVYYFSIDYINSDCLAKLSCFQLIEYGEFLFPLNGVFQFIVFYFFNSNFRDSFKNLIYKIAPVKK